MAQWQQVGTPPPRDLASTRAQLHWACQLLSAAADAHGKSADDSHSNVFVDSAVGGVVGRRLGGTKVALRFNPLAVALVEADGGTPKSFTLAGKSLEQARVWLSEQVGQPISFRDYEMPQHPVKQGAHFETEDDHADELRRWFENGTRALESVRAAYDGVTDVAIWPHHFDIGAILFVEPDAPAEKAKQIGLGMSPGDNHYSEPYFYVTPWPVPAGARLADLPHGGVWRSGDFSGGILTASAIVKANDQGSAADEFLRAAIDAGLEALR